jgi:hypothetical protein
MSTSPGPVHAIILHISPELADQLAAQGVEVPSVVPNKYVLLDDDAQQCSVIGDDELYASYIDRNIATYRLDAIENWPQVPNPDHHNVILSYENGTQTSIAIGSISLDPGPTPDQYYKTKGLIYPVNSSGAALLDATNTPNLSYIRNQYWDMARNKVKTDLFFAEIVATFASNVAALGHAGEASNFVTAEDIDGNVPIPADPPKDEVDHSDADSNN